MSSSVFFNIVSELVYKHMRTMGQNYTDLSIMLNLSESYIRKIHSRSTNKRYSLVHLSILAHEWKIPLDNFIPSVSTLEELPEYTNLSSQQRIEIINQIYEDIRGEV